MRELTPHLFWHESDTCSVYYLCVDEVATLIDCGTRLVPGTQTEPLLADVERVLLTHFHRDQCAAAPRWHRQGAGIVVPFAERRFFEEADLMRASFDIYDNYTSYYPCFSVAEDLQPVEYARDYETVSWRGVDFAVVPLPGHTFGSVGYQFEIDGRRVLACGDLLSGPGSLRDYHWCQWRYMDFQGHVNLLESLETVAALELDLILPGHGVPFEPDAASLERLQADLREIWERFNGRSYEPYRPQFRSLSEHVWEVENTSAKTYIVRDDAGHGLFIDCGYASGAPISASPHRFVDRLTPHLQSELGIHTVEYFLPTHYHDDHLAGFPALNARYGTKAVASRQTGDLISHPERYDMPCLLPEGVPLHRSLEPGELFDWRGIRFDIQPFPGQTVYDQHICFDVDGLSFVALGDAISGISFREHREHVHSFIPKNRTPLSQYGSIPRRLQEHAPDFLLTGHGGGVRYDPDQMELWRKWMDRWQDLFTTSVDRQPLDQAMDPRWVEFYPYKIRIRPGDERIFHIWVTNHDVDEPAVCELELRSVEGVLLHPDRLSLEVEAGSRSVAEISARFPTAFTTHSLPILADVTWNGQTLGEIAEAVAYW